MKSAFTLIELIIVISIIGLLSFFSISAFLRLKESLILEGTARQIQCELISQKQKAISSGAISELYCNQNYYSIKNQNILQNSSDIGKKTVMPSNIYFANSILFRFSSSGFPYPGYSGTAVIKNRFHKTKKIIISSLGRIRIE